MCNFIMYNDYIVTDTINSFVIPNFPNVTPPSISYNPSANNISAGVLFYINTIAINLGTNLVGAVSFNDIITNSNITQTSNFFTNI